MRETQAFLANLKSGRIFLESGHLNARLGYFWSEENKHRTQASLVQLVLLLDSFHKRYFRRLRLADFPESFAAQLTITRCFLERFNLSLYTERIRENTFSVAHTVELTHILQAVSAQEIQEFWQFLFLFEAYWSVTKTTVKHAFCLPTFHASALK